jgi:hypothetical protein
MRRILAPLAALTLAACGGGTESSSHTSTSTSTAPTGPTYHQDIAPLLAEHCTRCHQEGSIAPFALTTYDQVKTMAGAIAKATADRTMPPVNVDQSGACGTYKDANWLSDAQIATIKAWAEGGTIEGEKAAPITPPAPDHLGSDAITMTMAEAYMPQASGDHATDDYRCFFLDPKVAVDQYATGFEIIPGERTEVHHMLLYSLQSDNEEQKAQARDDADPLPGWSCFGGVDGNLLAAWAPGKDTVRYPTDTGIKISGGRRLVMQIHYNLLGGTAPDQTTIKLATVPDVKKEAALAPLSDEKLSLLPDSADATAGGQYVLALLGVPEIEMHGVAPHMHLLGRTEHLSVRDTGTDPADATCLMNVTNWNFHWQQLYFYEKSVILKSNQTVAFDCHYDTRGQTKTITYGEGTQDEMCIVYTYLTLPQGGKLPL